jgi:hypothetical protein
VMVNLLTNKKGESRVTGFFSFFLFFSRANSGAELLTRASEKCDRAGLRPRLC